MSASQITSSGFQFLLHTPHDQLWALLLQYLEMSEVCMLCTRMTRYLNEIQERKTDIVEVISFLFMLSTMELGKASGFPSVLAMAWPTVHLGVFSRRSHKSPRVYVVRFTRLRAGLAEEGGQPSELSDYVFFMLPIISRQRHGASLQHAWRPR